MTPEDIRPSWLDTVPDWLNVIRRLQAESGKQSGYALINITVMVDQAGNPVFWTEPQMTRLEPKSRAGEILQRLISGLR